MTMVRKKARASVRKSKPDAPEKSLTEDEREAIAPFAAGIAEHNRREQGDFDGLLGQFHESTAPLLSEILTDLREYLLDHTRSENKARGLLAGHSPRVGYRNVTPVTDDVALVLRLLNRIFNAANCEPSEYLRVILGEGGARDLKRQEGSNRGGAVAAAEKRKQAENRHAEWRTEADKLRKAGKADRNIAGIIADRTGVSAKQIRVALKKANLS